MARNLNLELYPDGPLDSHQNALIKAKSPIINTSTLRKNHKNTYYIIDEIDEDEIEAQDCGNKRGNCGIILPKSSQSTSAITRPIGNKKTSSPPRIIKI